jgi:hypothetical protein
MRQQHTHSRRLDLTAQHSTVGNACICETLSSQGEQLWENLISTLGIHLLSITASHSSHALQAATCQNMQYLTHSLGGTGVEARGGERGGERETTK